VFRFNESKKKFVHYLGAHHGDASHVVEHGEEMMFVAPVVLLLKKWQVLVLNL
jgi:hypothetical protein